MNTDIDNMQAQNEKTDEAVVLFRNRLGKCEVCNAVDARYTCPKCELKTCSLPCVQIHKKELDCDGKRDRTKFMPVRSMSNMDFMSDYYFLEECTRYVEDRKTDVIKRFTRFNRQLPTHLNRLRAAANERGTKLMYMLQNFTRHKNNTTYYDWKERRIYWRIEWIFSNAGERKYVDERCSEDEALWKLLTRYLDADEAALQNVPKRNELEFYQSKGVFNVKILLKAEHVKNCKKRFYELDATKTLKENLKGKILVEFPSIFLFCNDVDDLDILDSDEDIQAETKAFLDSLDNMRREEFAKARAKAKAEESCSDDDGLQNISTQLESKSDVIKPHKRLKLESETKNFLFNDNDEFSSSSDEEKQVAIQQNGNYNII